MCFCRLYLFLKNPWHRSHWTRSGWPWSIFKCRRQAKLSGKSFPHCSQTVCKQRFQKFTWYCLKTINIKTCRLKCTPGKLCCVIVAHVSLISVRRPFLGNVDIGLLCGRSFYVHRVIRMLGSSLCTVCECICMEVQSVSIFDVSIIAPLSKSTPNICYIWNNNTTFTISTERDDWVKLYRFTYLIDSNLDEGCFGSGRRFTIRLLSLRGSWNDWICVRNVFELSRTLSQNLHSKFNLWLFFKWVFKRVVLVKLKNMNYNTNSYGTVNWILSNGLLPFITNVADIHIFIRFAFDFSVVFFFFLFQALLWLVLRHRITNRTLKEKKEHNSKLGTCVASLDRFKTVRSDHKHYIIVFSFFFSIITISTINYWNRLVYLLIVGIVGFSSFCASSVSVREWSDDSSARSAI